MDARDANMLAAVGDVLNERLTALRARQDEGTRNVLAAVGDVLNERLALLVRNDDIDARLEALVPVIVGQVVEAVVGRLGGLVTESVAAAVEAALARRRPARTLTVTHSDGTESTITEQTSAVANAEDERLSPPVYDWSAIAAGQRP